MAIPLRRQIGLVAVAATAASGVLTLATASTAAPDPDRGDARARAAAEGHGISTRRAAEILSDPTAEVSSSGRIYYADPARPTPAAKRPALAAAAAPLSETFELHSLPGAQRVIYLDFNGGEVSGTDWNAGGLAEGFYPGWDPSGNGPTNFDATERTRIQDVWARVAEDYAPFAVDVTTEDPGPAAIDRSGPGDQVFGTRVLYTDDQGAEDAVCDGGCAGVAFLDVFDDAESHAQYQPVWVFPRAQGNKALAETTSHEVGHNFNLEHHGKEGVDEYYEGHGSWAPIMGFSDFEPMSHWSDGSYGGSTNGSQDDVATIAASGAPERDDEAGNTTEAAPGLPSGPAYISSRRDSDVFALGRCSGPVTVAAKPAPVGPNLDIELRILDPSGARVDFANPLSQRVSDDIASGLDATISRTLDEGTYFVQIDGVGRGPGDVSYDDYGSLGAYTVTSTGCAEPPPPDPDALSAPRDLAVTAESPTVAQVTWSPPADNGGSPITEYHVYLDGELIGTPGGDTAGGTISDLTPGETYEIGVSAVNAEGEGPRAEAPITMPDDPEPEPEPERISAALSGKNTRAKDMLRVAAPTVAAGAEVRLQVKNRRGWRTIRSGVLNRNGDKRFAVPDRRRDKRTYRAIVSATDTVTGDRSNAVRLR